MGALLAAALLLLVGSAPQAKSDPDQLLREADRLAWLRAWGAAEPETVRTQKPHLIYSFIILLASIDLIEDPCVSAIAFTGPNLWESPVLNIAANPIVMLDTASSGPEYSSVIPWS